MARLSALLVALAFTLPASVAASCLAGGCHAGVVSDSHLHGPLAIEQVGGTGCTACHAADGARCTATRPGRFRLRATADQLCAGCHDGETASGHSRRAHGCLTCHDPHGGATAALLRKATASAR